MKKIIYLLVVMNLTVVVSRAQNLVITVDNNVNASADFTTINEAMEAAQPGDTIYVTPSQTSYGSVTVAKRLHFRSIGHTPEVTNGLSAKIGFLSFHGTSNPPVTISSGSSIQGFEINGIGIGFTGPDNITIKNNKIVGNINLGGNQDCENWIIQGNVINGLIASSVTSNNWSITNNFIFGSNAGFSSLANDCVVSNNIVLVTSNQATHTLFSNSENVVTNNIFLANQANLGAFITQTSNVTFLNNLTFNYAGTTLATLVGSTNFNNANPAFLSVPTLLSTYSVNDDYHLPNNTSFLGTDGNQIGIYGLNFPFNKRGYSFNMPYVEHLQIMNPSVESSGTLQVQIRAKSN